MFYKREDSSFTQLNRAKEEKKSEIPSSKVVQAIGSVEEKIALLAEKKRGSINQKLLLIEKSLAKQLFSFRNKLFPSLKYINGKDNPCVQLLFYQLMQLILSGEPSRSFSKDFEKINSLIKSINKQGGNSLLSSNFAREYMKIVVLKMCKSDQISIKKGQEITSSLHNAYKESLSA